MKNKWRGKKDRCRRRGIIPFSIKSKAKLIWEGREKRDENSRKCDMWECRIQYGMERRKKEKMEIK